MFIKTYFSYILFWIFFLATSFVSSQTTQLFKIQIEPIVDDTTLILGKNYRSDSLQIHTLRFYLSNFHFFKGNKHVWAEANSYHLVDAAFPKTMLLSFNIPKNIDFDRLQCDLGIDSLTNTEGAKSGDLDPTKGMYWAWQSGYINFKLEGKSHLCPTRRNIFQFHIGGFLDGEYALQRLQFAILSDNRVKKPIVTEGVVLQLDVSHFLSKMNLREKHTLMSPSNEAVEYAQALAACFKLKNAKKSENGY